MNIRERRRALTIAALTLLLATAAGSYWAWQERSRQIASLDEVDRHIAAFEDRLLDREQVLAEIRRLEAQNPSGTLLLQGATAAIAAAELQGLANAVIEAAGGRVASSELLRAQDIPPFLEVGVSLQFTATIEALRDILYALESSIPAIIVTSIDASQNDEATRELRISLQIKGFASIAAS